jgi:hypothetical protein
LEELAGGPAGAPQGAPTPPVAKPLPKTEGAASQRSRSLAP